MDIPAMKICTRHEPPANRPARQPPAAPSFSPDDAPNIAPPIAKITRIKRIHIL